MAESKAAKARRCRMPHAAFRGINEPNGVAIKNSKISYKSDTATDGRTDRQRRAGIFTFSQQTKKDRKAARIQILEVNVKNVPSAKYIRIRKGAKSRGTLGHVFGLNWSWRGN